MPISPKSVNKFTYRPADWAALVAFELRERYPERRYDFSRFSKSEKTGTVHKHESPSCWSLIFTTKNSRFQKAKKTPGILFETAMQASAKKALKNQRNSGFPGKHGKDAGRIFAISKKHKKQREPALGKYPIFK